MGVGGHVVSSPESVFDLAGVYPLKMAVVGVLAPTHTPDDDAVFVDVKTAWVIAGLAHGFDLVLANPPFGKKGSFTIVGEDGKVSKDKDSYERDDFWATTSNKQLNFVQHIRTMLKLNGEAAVVLPDNVLFEGGAGETVRKKLLQNTDLHTIGLRGAGTYGAFDLEAEVAFQFGSIEYRTHLRQHKLNGQTGGEAHQSHQPGTATRITFRHTGKHGGWSLLGAVRTALGSDGDRAPLGGTCTG